MLQCEPMYLLDDCLNHFDNSNVAIICEHSGCSVSYARLAQDVYALSSVMQSAGIGAGMRLSVAMPGSIEFVVAILASINVGAVAAPLDLSLKGESLKRSMASLRPHAVLTSYRAGNRYNHMDSLLGLCFSVGLSECGIIRNSSSSNDVQVGQNTIGSEGNDALLISTSGTTGVPRYVRLGAEGTAFNIRSHLESFGFSGSMRNLQVLPVNYSYGCIASLLGTLVNGGVLIFPERLDGVGIANALRLHRPDTLYLSPALAEYLVDMVGPDRGDWFSSLQRVGIGGDTCPPALRGKIASVMPQTKLYVTFGVTEAGPRVATLASEEFLTHPYSVGRAIRGVSFAVSDGEGQPCRVGEVGRLQITTPSAMKGYLDHPPLNSLAVVSGDLARIDADGRLTLMGRSDRQIKLRGTRVHLNQIEMIVGHLPGVRCCEVKLDQDMGRLVADVIFDPLRVSDPQQFEELLRRHCRMHLPNRHVPAEFRLQSASGYFFKGRPVAALSQ